MARKAVVDRDIVLNMLKEGKTTQYIANKFSVSRQAIDLYRRDFISSGSLPNQRAKRTGTERIKTERKRATLLECNVVSLDEQIELIIKAFGALKRLPQLEAELEIYKRKCENAVQEIQLLREAVKKRQNQEHRWYVVQQQMDSDASLEKGGEPHNF